MKFCMTLRIKLVIQSISNPIYLSIPHRMAESNEKKQKVDDKRYVIIDDQKKELKIAPSRLQKSLLRNPSSAIKDFVKYYELSYLFGEPEFKEIELRNKYRIRVMVKHIRIKPFIDAKYQGKDDSEIFTRVGLDLHRKFHKLVIDQNVFVEGYNSNKSLESFVRNKKFKK